MQNKMLSQLSRRALFVGRNRAPILAKRMVSTHTYAQVQALEKLFDNLHWHDARDKVEEIRELMDEHKTNHAIKIPPLKFEDMVTDTLRDIELMAQQVGSEHDAVFHRVFDVEREVKDALYPH